MQIGNFNPILLILAFLVFFTVFVVYGYSRGLLWFQQDSTKRAESLLASFNARDEASGGWYRRFGKPVIVLFIVHVISYPVVTNLVVLSPVQFFIFVFGYYIPSGVILTAVLFIMWRRIQKQPVPEETDPDQTDKSAFESQ
ncbi:MAG: hypothetical protein JW779_00780 [Candidatus Thorarchaeota archaeon]|nr:hypothetical protein [Candidatus Thorarchaeota archaeon]